MLVCWSVGGGVGTSVVAAGLALAASRAGDEVLLVDVGGDQPLLFGVPDPPGPGLGEWTAAAPDVGGEALGRLEAELRDGVTLLPLGQRAPDPARAAELLAALEADRRFVVVDAGLVEPGGFVDAVVAGAARSLLVARACPVSLRRIEACARKATEVVVVRDRRRSVSWQDVAEAAAAPVTAELEVDPAVAAAVDAGLAHRALPRQFVRVLGGLR